MRQPSSDRDRSNTPPRRKGRDGAPHVPQLLVVDEHPIVGVALRALLSGEPAAFAVETSTDPEAALRAIRDGSTDVIVSEIAFSGTARGLDFVRSRPRPAIVFLTAMTYPSLVQAALDAKPEGIVSKFAPTAEIVEAIRAVASGGTVVGADVLQAARLARRRPAPRELAVIAEVATGATNRQVAERLSIQRPTVEAVLRRLFDRYSVASRTALVRIAVSEGWLLGGTA